MAITLRPDEDEEHVARTLIVDDEPDLRCLMARYLEADGHEVQEAGNGAAGLERLHCGLLAEGT